MLEELCEHLHVGQVGLVGNDNGRAVAQVIAALQPERIRTCSLPNCDVHENVPPAVLQPSIDMAARGEFGPLVAARAGDVSLAKSDVGFGQDYQHPEASTDESLLSDLGPFVGDNGKALERFLTASNAEKLMGIEQALGRLQGPSQVDWGTGDRFFESLWAERLRTMIPGVERAVEIPDAMLFFPDERAGELIPLLRNFWELHG
jgi:pimeloyl-ACP methyl ester carboxylesterase